MPHFADVFEQKHVSSFVICCSFCHNKIRKDVPVYTDSRKGQEEIQAKKDAETQALQDGWKSHKTTQGALLNLCPDHVHQFTEMEIIK